MHWGIARMHANRHFRAVVYFCIRGTKKRVFAWFYRRDNLVVGRVQLNCRV